jgi:hypothetical protein
MSELLHDTVIIAHAQPTMELFEPHTLNSWIPLLWEEAPSTPLSGQSNSSTNVHKQTVLSAVGDVLKAVVDEEITGERTPLTTGEHCNP